MAYSSLPFSMCLSFRDPVRINTKGKDNFSYIKWRKSKLSEHTRKRDQQLITEHDFIETLELIDCRLISSAQMCSVISESRRWKHFIRCWCTYIMSATQMLCLHEKSNRASTSRVLKHFLKERLWCVYSNKQYIHYYCFIMVDVLRCHIGFWSRGCCGFQVSQSQLWLVPFKSSYWELGMSHFQGQMERIIMHTSNTVIKFNMTNTFIYWLRQYFKYFVCFNLHHEWVAPGIKIDFW